MESMIRSALELAKITSEDPYSGLPEPGDLGSVKADLGLYDDAIAALATEWKIAQAQTAEEVALSADPRIQNSEGASFDSYRGMHVFANSRGFVGSYRTTS